MSTTVDPSQSLYIKGLPEKVLVEEIKASLYALFLSYGDILDIVIKKNNKMRGQAFIVFEEISAATAALRSLNGFSFYDNNINIQYAKSKSDAIAKLDGTYKPKLSAEDIKRKATSAAAMSATKRQKSSDSDDEDAKMGRVEESEDDSD
ncbi:hypothetical protein INT43_006461 [Umbelopsis isabellina]|uniref:RRM domain-containing protein n=1 Tax=Mortierella isabellina TaxID=91625 RepID=A0A8H7UHN8_MORIS|nr:hypothetical protein INT43_006461 [Umbelopsis isabellina]